MNSASAAMPIATRIRIARVQGYAAAVAGSGADGNTSTVDGVTLAAAAAAAAIAGIRSTVGRSAKAVVIMRRAGRLAALRPANWPAFFHAAIRRRTRPRDQPQRRASAD